MSLNSMYIFQSFIISAQKRVPSIAQLPNHHSQGRIDIFTNDFDLKFTVFKSDFQRFSFRVLFTFDRKLRFVNLAEKP